MIDKMQLGGDYPRDPQGLEQAFAADVDFYGNGQRGLFPAVIPSLIDFLQANTSVLEDYGAGTSGLRWCDVGIGGGFAMEAVLNECAKRGYYVLPSGVDVSGSAVLACQQKWPHGDFRTVNMDEYIRKHDHEMPWHHAHVVSFIEVLYMFKDYRWSFNQVYADLAPGTVVVVSDCNIRYHRRVYPKSLPDCAFLGAWTDFTMPVVPPDPSIGQKTKNIKYAVYRKMA